MFKQYIKKLLLIFGDSSIEAYFYYGKKDQYIDSIFFDEDINQSKLSELLDRYKKSQLLIVLQSNRENTEVITYPDIGRLNIAKKINKKIGKRLRNSGIRDALLIQKPSLEEDSWKYYFVEYTLPDKARRHFNAVLSHSIELKGVYLYSFEILKVASYLNDLIKKKDKISESSFYFISKLGFIKKINFKSNQFKKIKNINFTDKIDIKQYLESEAKTFSSSSTPDTNKDFFIIGDIDVEKISLDNCKDYLLNFSTLQMNNKINSKALFDDNLCKYINKLHSNPIKLTEIKEITKYQKMNRYLFITFSLFLLLLSYFIYSLDIELKQAILLHNLRLKTLNNASKSKFALEEQLASGQKIIQNDKKMEGIYELIKNYNYPIEVLSVIHSSKNDNINIRFFNYSSQNHTSISFEVLFKDINQKTPIGEVKSYIQKLRQKLPNYNITYHRKNPSYDEHNSTITMMVKVEES